MCQSATFMHTPAVKCGKTGFDNASLSVWLELVGVLKNSYKVSTGNFQWHCLFWSIWVVFILIFSFLLDENSQTLKFSQSYFLFSHFVAKYLVIAADDVIFNQLFELETLEKHWIVPEMFYILYMFSFCMWSECVRATGTKYLLLNP